MRENANTYSSFPFLLFHILFLLMRRTKVMPCQHLTLIGSKYLDLFIMKAANIIVKNVEVYKRL